MTDFAEFWAIWPRKVDKAEAELLYADALKGKLTRQRKLGRPPATHQEIMAGTERYKLDKPDYADWLHPTTFLRRLRWEDEGGSEVIEPERDRTADLAMMRREHEAGYTMYPSLAEHHGWAEYGSVAPKLKVVG